MPTTQASKHSSSVSMIREHGCDGAKRNKTDKWFIRRKFSSKTCCQYHSFCCLHRAYLNDNPVIYLTTQSMMESVGVSSSDDLTLWQAIFSVSHQIIWLASNGSIQRLRSSISHSLIYTHKIINVSESATLSPYHIHFERENSWPSDGSIWASSTHPLTVKVQTFPLA